MGRRENPVDHTAPHRGRLAEYLRQHRRRAGLTYQELQERTGLSQATLKRAASGTVLPKQDVAETYVSGCGGAEEAVQEVRELWRAARIEKRGRPSPLRALRPELVSDAGDLSKALVALWERVGAPSPRQMRERSGIPAALPVSSCYLIVGRQALPADATQLRAFLLGCGVPEDQHGPWERALEKVKRRSSSSSEVDRLALTGLGKTLEAGLVAMAMGGHREIRWGSRRPPKRPVMPHPVLAELDARADGDAREAAIRRRLAATAADPGTTGRGAAPRTRWADLAATLPAEILDRVLEAGMRTVLAEEAGRNGVGPPPVHGRRADAVAHDGEKWWITEAKRYGSGGGPAHQEGAAGPVRPSGSGGPQPASRSAGPARPPGQNRPAAGDVPRPAVGAAHPCARAEEAQERRQRNEEITAKIRGHRVPDDYELLGLTYLHHDPATPDRLGDDTLEKWIREAEASPSPAQGRDLAGELRAIAARTT
ncbi:helix-turn-helix domain-containing protein [Streptomyces chitinivorans]|uniref:Helix-turn-helix domain-containing protein n=1 Tax=Streptomyces chitinivorans TaxID=1257027 RepID=A0ABW7HZF9_9ACTN|nr:helix-turn-helix transcriptional regulator [Streptomyces chitinivorans]MDH2412366.1 helix-turn-helix domain-containing protein [Streptomyces chitinivorans]